MIINKIRKWIVGKTFHKKKELFPQLFFNALKKYKDRVLFCVLRICCYQKYFLQKDMAEIMISQMISCLLHVAPSACHAYVIPRSSLSSQVCLIFPVTDKYSCPTDLCWVKDMFWEEGKGEKAEFG